jgi:hypothetical protein
LGPTAVARPFLTLLSGGFARRTLRWSAVRFPIMSLPTMTVGYFDCDLLFFKGYYVRTWGFILMVTSFNRTVSLRLSAICISIHHQECFDLFWSRARIGLPTHCDSNDFFNGLNRSCAVLGIHILGPHPYHGWWNNIEDTALRSLLAKFTSWDEKIQSNQQVILNRLPIVILTNKIFQQITFIIHYRDQEIA